MPPRHAYWTILVDNQPTAFRAHDPEDLLATLNRLKEKHPSAVMKWFERGALWDSRDAAREAGFGQGERRWEGPRPRNHGDTEGRPPRDLDTKDPGSAPRRETQRAAERERPRDKNWRPGGEHRDPHQKYKDAKKAKWQRFKQKVRAGWEARHDDTDRPRSTSARPRDEHPRDDGPRRDRPRDDRPPHDTRRDLRPADRRPDDRRRDRPREDRPREDRPREDRPREDRPRADQRPDDRRRDQRWSDRGPTGQKSWPDGRDQRGSDRPPRRDGWKPKPSWSDRPRRTEDVRGSREERREGRPDQRDRGWRPKGPPRGDRPAGTSSGGGWPKRRPEHREWRDRPPRDRERPPSSTRPYDRDAPRPRGSKPSGPAGGKPFGRKPWGAKPPGGRPKGKPFGPRGPRGPGRPPGRGPRKPRDDE